MGFWRKKDEDFEWREYVRTTILLRRQERRQKIEDIKAAAVGGVKAGGRKGFEAAAKGVNVAGSGLQSGASRFAAAARHRAGQAFALVWEAVKWAASAAAAGIRAGLPVVGGVLVRLGERLRETIATLAGSLIQPERAGPLGLVALGATLAGLYLVATSGLTGGALITLAVAVVTGALSMGLKWQSGEPALPWDKLTETLESIGRRVVWLPIFERFSLAAAGILAVCVVFSAGALAWRVAPMGWPTLPSLSALNILPQPPEDLTGRARAIDGATLRIDGRLVRLQGIEAPAANQDCIKEDNKSWNCGASARKALARALGGRNVVCQITGAAEEDGPAVGTCKAGDDDIAAGLVRDGYVFAGAGLFAAYAAEEREAEEKKVGLWAGTPERPDAWRDRLWEEAKSTAPDGCPIKGEVYRGQRLYVLPWSPRYKRARIYEGRGERWFCSEEEAVDAGWKPRKNS